MKSFRHLDHAVDLIFKNNLSLQQIIWMSKKEKEQTDIFFKNLGSSGLAQPKYPKTELDCDIINYRGVTFYIMGYNI